MNIKENKKLIIIAGLSGLLFVSLAFNFYQDLSISTYTDGLEEKLYKNIEEINSRNEYIYLSTDLILKSETISNNELLDLYNNYKMICLAEANILEINLNYKEAENGIVQNNLFLRAEEYIKSLLINNGNKSEDKRELTLDEIESIKIIRDSSEEINNYFISIEEKYDKVINKDSWIEIMKEIQKIGDSYSSYSL